MNSEEEVGILRGYTVRYDPTVIPLYPDIAHAPELPAEGYGGGFYSAESYTRLYASGELSPVTVAKKLLGLVNPDVRASERKAGKRGLATAWCSVNANLVLKQAKESERRWAVHRARLRGEYVPDSEPGVRFVEMSGGRKGCIEGVFIGVKDELLIQDYPLTFGTTRHLPDYPAPSTETAWAIKMLLENGAVLLGITTMHEWGLDTTNCNPLQGTPLNPYSPEYYPGGSSGGSASAVGCGIVPISVGCDGGGSVRVPAAYCGVYGLKTSHGRVSERPQVLGAPSVRPSSPLYEPQLNLNVCGI